MNGAIQGHGFLQHLYLPVEIRYRLEELDGFVDGHIEDVADRFAFIADLEGFAVIAFAIAFFAMNIDVGQEIHFDDPHPAAFTDVAAAAFDVEGEAAGVITPDLCFRNGSE